MTARRRLLLIGSLGCPLALILGRPLLQTPIWGASEQMQQLSRRLTAHLGVDEAHRMATQFGLRYNKLREGSHLTEESVLRLMQQEDAANSAWVDVDGIRLSATQLGIILSAHS